MNQQKFQQENFSFEENDDENMILVIKYNYNYARMQRIFQS